MAKSSKQKVAGKVQDADGFVTIPVAELEALIRRVEDAEDRRSIETALKNPDDALPAESVERMIAGESPLRIFREHRGLTLQALADQAGVGKSHLSQIENGKKSGSIDIYAKLADILDVTIDDLV